MVPLAKTWNTSARTRLVRVGKLLDEDLRDSGESRKRVPVSTSTRFLVPRSVLSIPLTTWLVHLITESRSPGNVIPRSTHRQCRNRPVERCELTAKKSRFETQETTLAMDAVIYLTDFFFVCGLRGLRARVGTLRSTIRPPPPVHDSITVAENSRCTPPLSVSFHFDPLVIRIPVAGFFLATVGFGMDLFPPAPLANVMICSVNTLRPPLFDDPRGSCRH